MNNKSAVALLLVFTVVVIPPLVFIFVALLESMSFADTLFALSEQYISRRQNLLVCGLLGLFPLALMGCTLWAHRRFGGDQSFRPALLMGGFIPIILILLWANIEYWPDFLPSRVYPGFPHGLELMLAPIFFAPVGMLLGMLVVRIGLGRRT